MNWLKFNIYSILLSFIAAILITSMILLWNYLSIWIIVPGLFLILSIINKATSIFRRYQYKIEIFEKLTAKLKQKYDLRYCQPYMDSACMRSVVYFSLYEVGKHKDYPLLKKRKKTIRAHSEGFKITNVRSEGGKLIFTSRNILTGEIEENEV